jgi:type I restriction enzyme S subunit
MTPNSNLQAWRHTLLGNVTNEVSERVGKSDETPRIYGVERGTGLTPTPKYVAKDLSRYKKIESGMFAYNPMRLNIGSLGFCSSAHHPGAVSPDYVVFQCDPLYLDPLYMDYVTQSQHWDDWVRGAGVGSVRVRIYYRELAKMPLRIPPVEEQRAIVAVLGALDSKIKLNRQIGRSLEELVRATFKAWFVDFEPVKAKAAGQTSYPGMPAAAFAALPECLTNSPLGPVPEGWGVGLLGDEVRVIKGRSYKSTELRESRTALVTLKSIERGGGYRPDGLKPYVGDYKEEQVLNPGDLVVAFTDLTQDAAVVGKPAIVRKDARFDTLVASLDLGIMRPNGRLGIPYLYCLCKTEDFQRHVYGHTNGSTVLHLGKAGVPSYPIVLPDLAVLDAFDRVVAPYFDLTYANELESTQLSTLRDYLLPRLLSGRVRVPPAKSEVSA